MSGLIFKMTADNRISCILDTSSLIFSFKTELSSKLVIKRLDDRFNLIFPSKVVDEYSNQFKKRKFSEYKDIEPDLRLFIEKKRNEGKIIGENEYSDCLDYVKRWFNLLKMEENFWSLGDGEKHCIALALYWSRRTRQPLLLISDDYKARADCVDYFICKQRIGSVDSIPGLIILIYSIQKEIPELNVRASINTYFNLFKDKTIYFDNLRKEFIKELNLSCRAQNFESCKLKCLV